MKSDIILIIKFKDNIISEKYIRDGSLVGNYIIQKYKEIWKIDITGYLMTEYDCIGNKFILNIREEDLIKLRDSKLNILLNDI